MAQQEKPDVCTPEAVVKQASQGHDVSAKFNAECSPAERREFFQSVQEKGTPTDSQLKGTHAASMLDGFKINFDSAKRTLDSVETASGKALKVDSLEGAKATEKPALAKPAKAAEAVDPGRPGVDDIYSKSMRGALRIEERPVADAIHKKLMSGDNISNDINALDRDAKVRVMAEIKGRIAEKPGTKVEVSQDSGTDASRYITMKTADGKQVLFTESNMGLPKDVQFNPGGIGNRLRNVINQPGQILGGANDLYDREGEAGAKSAARDTGPSWVDKLKGPPIDTTKGPLGRYLNQQPMEPGDEAALQKLRDKGILKDVVERKRD